MAKDASCGQEAELLTWLNGKPKSLNLNKVTNKDPYAGNPEQNPKTLNPKQKSPEILPAYQLRVYGLE